MLAGGGALVSRLAAPWVAAAAVTVVGVSGAANAAMAPTVELSFSPAKISAGTQPDITFVSQDVPSGPVLYLQESLSGSGQWAPAAKTTDTQSTANIAALSQGVYGFEIIVDNGTKLAVSAPRHADRYGSWRHTDLRVHRYRWAVRIGHPLAENHRRAGLERNRQDLHRLDPLVVLTKNANSQ